MSKTCFSEEEAKIIGNTLGVDWARFSVEEFCIGLEIELEHGTKNPKTNITNDDGIMTGKLVMAHLNEFPDYYSRLEKMEKEAEQFWAGKLAK